MKYSEYKIKVYEINLGFIMTVENINEVFIEEYFKKDEIKKLHEKGKSSF
jgi:hypothetical protein